MCVRVCALRRGRVRQKCKKTERGVEKGYTSQKEGIGELKGSVFAGSSVAGWGKQRWR